MGLLTSLVAASCGYRRADYKATNGIYAIFASLRDLAERPVYDLPEDLD